MTELVLTPPDAKPEHQHLRAAIASFAIDHAGNVVDGYKLEQGIVAFLERTKLAPALDGEPIFVLRAQDKIAPSLVLQWANDAARHDVNAPKSIGAMQISHEMIAWQMAHPDRVKVPD